MNLKCPICSIHNCKYIESPAYCICKECGHVYQLQLFNKEYYHSLPCSFPKDYEKHAIRRSQYILDFIEQYSLQSLKLTEDILDVGSGPGLVLKEIQEKLAVRGKYPICFGYTLSKENNPHILQIDVENDNLPNKTYDIIILSHVLEHFLNPIETLKKLESILLPNGIIYIEVPSFYWCEVRTKSVFTPEHLSFFTKNSIENVIKSSYLEPTIIKESKYWGNIKAICKKPLLATNNYDIKKVDYDKVLMYYYLIKLLYPWYRFISKIKSIDANA